MFKFLRNFFKSKVGIVVTLAFLVVIAIAFASSDVSNSGTFGGIAGGDNVAIVGDKKISNAELRQAAENQVNQLRQQNPSITMADFVKEDGLEKVLDSMINRYAVSEYAREHGLRAGDNLVNSEIIKIPNFQGPDGKFDQERYKAVLSQNGITDKMVRGDFADGLLAQQLLYPASYGALVPTKFVSRYAGVLKERRSGAIALISSNSYAPKGEPSAEQLSQYYKANLDDYMRPERRVIRYVTFDSSAVNARVAPTDNQIAAKYKADSAKYAAREERAFTQLIVPTQAAAKSIADRVNAGGSLESAAQQAGLKASKVGPLDKAETAKESSQAVANAVFSTPQGKLAAPTKGGLGWYVIRVDQVNKIPARSLADARDEITKELTEQNKRQAISDLAVSIEEQVDKGANMTELAEQVKGKVVTTPEITANGQVYGTNERAPDAVAPILQVAFQMPEEGEAQLATSPDGSQFIIFEASKIVPATAAPLKDVQQQVAADWRNAQGKKKANEVAEKVVKSLNKGVPISKALASAGASSAPVQNVDMTREQLFASGQRIPPPVALMFSMAQGTAKKLEAPDDFGWMVVDLDSIKPGTITKDDPLFAQAKTQISEAMGNEYAEQLQAAILKAVTVKRNPNAIAAVERQLTGQN